MHVRHCAQFRRGPKIFIKGTKRGPDFEQKGDQKKGTKTLVVQKIKKSLQFEIFQKLNLNEERSMFVSLLSFKQTVINLNENS